MSNENTQTVVTEKARGDRGELGKGTAGGRIKALWHSECFTKKDLGLTKIAGTPSLKAFARAKSKEGNQDAKDWFECKAGALNESRSDKNKTRVSLEKQASKAARKKTKGGGGKATAATAALPK
jgi:hypothetical protein